MNAKQPTENPPHAPRAARAEPTRRESPRALRRVPSSPPPARGEGSDLRVVELIAGARRHVVARPVSATLAALGIGFVLGGALSFRAGRIAMATLGRRLAVELLKEFV